MPQKLLQEGAADHSSRPTQAGNQMLQVQEYILEQVKPPATFTAV